MQNILRIELHDRKRTFGEGVENTTTTSLPGGVEYDVNKECSLTRNSECDLSHNLANTS